MVTAPEDNVISHADAVLQHVALEDERVLTDLDVLPHKRLAADVRNAGVAVGFDHFIQTPAQTVELGSRHGHECPVFGWRIGHVDLIQRHDGKTADRSGLHKFQLRREGNNLLRGVVREIFERISPRSPVPTIIMRWPSDGTCSGCGTKPLRLMQNLGYCQFAERYPKCSGS
jgi:hypothetical protein